MMRTLFLQPIHDVTASLEQLATAKRPFGALAVTFVALLVTWFVYVPIHELLHVYGCLVTGGSVSQLEIQPQYGGAILSKYFDFVVSGGTYAGRLSGFDTHGSDLTYLATDFMPFTLSVLIGVPLLKSCTSRRRPIRFGVSIVVGMAPLYNIFGDYYEMASIMISRAVTVLTRAKELSFEGLRSDDIFALVGHIVGLAGAVAWSDWTAVASLGILTVLGFCFGVLLAFATYAAGHFLWVPLFPGTRIPKPTVPAPVPTH